MGARLSWRERADKATRTARVGPLGARRAPSNIQMLDAALVCLEHFVWQAQHGGCALEALQRGVAMARNVARREWASTPGQVAHSHAMTGYRLVRRLEQSPSRARVAAAEVHQVERLITGLRELRQDLLERAWTR